LFNNQRIYNYLKQNGLFQTFQNSTRKAETGK